MNIILVGFGRMGRCFYDNATQSGERIVAAVDPESDFSGLARGVGARSLGDVKEDADVLVDFSYHTSVYAIKEFALKRRMPVVIATTGHSEEERAAIEELAEAVPVFYASNMSYGVLKLCELAAELARAFPYADVEIVETHHIKKRDIPSGTALMLANVIKQARGKGTIIAGRRDPHSPGEIGISSLRLGGTVGIHKVIFNTGFQTFTLVHEAHSRSIYAIGAVNAARFITTCPKGLYSVKDMHPRPQP